MVRRIPDSVYGTGRASGANKIYRDAERGKKNERRKDGKVAYLPRQSGANSETPSIMP